MKTRYVILILVAIQLGFILLLRADFLTDWDSYLYTHAALHLQPVGLAGGRWFFTAFLGSVWQLTRLFHAASPESAWQAFSILTIPFALVNVVLFFALARRWLDRGPALIAAGLFVASPMIGLYGSAVMTETYTLTALLAALLVLSPLSASSSSQGEDRLAVQRLCGQVPSGDQDMAAKTLPCHPDKKLGTATSVWRVVLAGVFFGLGCAIREPLILLAPLPMGLVADGRKFRRWPKAVLFLAIVCAVLAANFLFVRLTAENWGQISKSWSMGMARERLQMIGWMPTTVLVNFFCLICWLGLFSPVLIITIPEQIRVFRTRAATWMMPLLIALLLYILGQIINHTLVFNPRFILFPAALLCLPAAWGLWRKIPERFQNAWVIAGILIVLHLCILGLGWPVLQGYYFDKSRAAGETYATLARAPANAMFIPGRLTPVVDFYKKLNQTDWYIIYGGWDFSDKELFQEIERSRDTGRRVYIVESDYWAERRFRPLQYDALQDVWDRYQPHPSRIAHFSRIDLPPAEAPREFLRRLMNFLFS